MLDYFLWNLPLFSDAEFLKARLSLQFPGAIVDIFRPSKPRHQTHGGCARILTNKNLAFTQKTEIDLGFRFPVFAKLSERPKLSPPSKPRVLCNVSTCDDSSDMKSCDSLLSISTCRSFNIVTSSLKMENCCSIDILPAVPGFISLQNGIDIAPDLDDLTFDLPLFETSALERIDICPDVTVELVSRSRLKNFRYALALLLRAFQNIDAGAYGLEDFKKSIQSRSSFVKLQKLFTMDVDGSFNFDGLCFNAGSNAWHYEER